MKALFLVFALSTASALFAQGVDKCSSSQFACNVKKPQSSTCCDQKETCGVSSDGKAQCLISTADRNPKAASPIAAPKAAVSTSKKK